MVSTFEMKWCSGRSMGSGLHPGSGMCNYVVAVGTSAVVALAGVDVVEGFLNGYFFGQMLAVPPLVRDCGGS